MRIPVKVCGAAILACALALLSTTAIAGHSRPWHSVVLTGSIVVAPNGSVLSYALDHPKKIGPVAVRELAKAIPRWKFKPVLRAGKPVTFKSYMSVRLVAKPTAKGGAAISVSGAYFSAKPLLRKPMSSFERARVIRKAAREARRHPGRGPDLDLHGFLPRPGRVSLALQMDHAGKVERVAVRQVDLFAKGTPEQMKAWRDTLGKLGVYVVKQRTFRKKLPAGTMAGKDAHTMLFTFTIHIGGGYSRQPHYGKWYTYVPGPLHPVPWLHSHLLAAGSANALPADGSAHPLRQSLQLLTPLGDSSGS